MVKLINLFPPVIKWNLLFWMSISVFALIFISLPFSPFASTIFSFLLLSMWSRIPCHIGYYTKDMEIIDFFAVVIGVNIGLLWGGMWGFAVMWFTSVYGKCEAPLHTMASSLGMLAGGLVAPFAYAYFNNSLLLAMYTFTVARYVVGYAVVFTIGQAIAFEEIKALVPCLIIAYITNTIYVLLFGDYFTTKLLVRGMQIDWTLVLFMGCVLAVLTYVKFKPPEPVSKEEKHQMDYSKLKEERPSWKDYSADSGNTCPA
ncbi:hypothetical protein ACFLQI_00325 [Candidatus Undinarchaeota archaeon]